MAVKTRLNKDGKFLCCRTSQGPSMLRGISELQRELADGHGLGRAPSPPASPLPFIVPCEVGRRWHTAALRAPCLSLGPAEPSPQASLADGLCGAGSPRVQTLEASAVWLVRTELGALGRVGAPTGTHGRNSSQPSAGGVWPFAPTRPVCLLGAASRGSPSPAAAQWFGSWKDA